MELPGKERPTTAATVVAMAEEASSSSRLPETIILEDEVWVLRQAKLTTFNPYDEYGMILDLYMLIFRISSF